MQVSAIISRLHVAFDFDPRLHVSREYVIDWLRRNTHLRYRRQSDDAIEVDQTRYAVRSAGRSTRPSRNIAVYATRVGKLDGEVDKIHFEIRLENSRAVKSAKIEAPIDLITLNPRILFDRYVKTGSTDQFIDKMIKRTIEQTRPTPLIDVDKRVRAIMMRTGCNSLTAIKQYYPRQSERIKALNVLSISDALEWVRPGVIDDDGGQCVENVVFVTPTPETTSHPHRKSAPNRKTVRRIQLNQTAVRTRDGEDFAHSPIPDTSRPRKPPLTGHSAIGHHRKRGVRGKIRNRLTGGNDVGRYGTDRDDFDIEQHLAAKPTETRVPRSKSRRTTRPDDRRRLDPRTAIKDAMYENPDISTRELKTELERLGISLSVVAISNIKNEHRHSLRFLIDQGATHLNRLL